jgi:hypothetical protein
MVQLAPDDPLCCEADCMPSKQRKKRARIVGEYYLISREWLDRAALVSGHYLVLAARLYLGWRGRSSGAETVAVTAALSGPGYSRRGRREIVRRLAEAGLIEVVERSASRAPRVRLIDRQLV